MFCDALGSSEEELLFCWVCPLLACGGVSAEVYAVLRLLLSLLPMKELLFLLHEIVFASRLYLTFS